MKYKDLDIIFENNDFIAINKPAGLFSVPDRSGKETSLKQVIEQEFEKIYIVHRLDKETSGIIIFAKNAIVHKALSEMFEHRKIEKYYVGLVNGSLYNQTGTIDAAIAEHHTNKGQMMTSTKGKASLTNYEVLKDYKLYSWVKFRIHTGRMHQIRVHSKHIGHAIVCDSLYGDGKPVLLSAFKKKYKLSKNELDETPILSRVGLHAYQLIFEWNDKKIDLIAEPPKDLRALLQQLEKNAK
ncbi:MAG: RNA pseudouridine synthase [Bacteroidetes bacterium]|nr:RNA pseudouridine synthase [Bacteroidota bacterium]